MFKIERVKIGEIKLYEKNAKNHPDWQVEQIKNSIKEFGYNDPIAIDDNNVIVEGHGRYLALKEIGYDEIEVLRLSHMNEDQKKAYIIAHNKTCMNTGFNLEMLEEELKSIAELDLTLTGFTEFEIDDMLGIKNDINIDSVLSDIEIEKKEKEPKVCPHCGGEL
ncbi:ParB/Srx family N-terminal domain-containing protein [Fusobacterium mortiferum]|uniref:ParB N-terminal domain-containing protein n=1 Tax=Fusobacterium mortiferum TaxID=850 RepID=A0ABS2FYQ0_FUSMR|nr:ParB/Srx family N-terminal domain-containing protein [Fusobacterium mortiferum]MBM6874276.1 ParB N-terminal domain-containing protein [Fusobacterium mortiferum]